MTDSYSKLEAVQTDVAALAVIDYQGVDNTDVVPIEVQIQDSANAPTAGTTTHSITIPKARVNCAPLIMNMAYPVHSSFTTLWTYQAATCYMRLEVVTADPNLILTAIRFDRVTAAGVYKYNMGSISVNAAFNVGVNSYLLGSFSSTNWLIDDRLQVMFLVTNNAAHASSTMTFKTSQACEFPFKRYGTFTGAARLEAYRSVLSAMATPDRGTRIFADDFALNHYPAGSYVADHTASKIALGYFTVGSGIGPFLVEDSGTHVLSARIPGSQN